MTTTRTEGTQEGKDTAPEPGPLPPYVVIKRFLDDELISRLLDHALQNEAKFSSTTIRKGVIDPSRRISVGLSDLGPMKAEIKNRLRDLVPSLIEQLRVTPFELSGIELELVAHGDGAFYKRHIDTFTGDVEGETTQRMISGVYYFHAEPKAFVGGDLRLHAFGAPDENTKFFDIPPDQNTLVVFPSWAIHEVLPIACPSKRFVDSRFAINCWIRRTKPGHKS
jgi:Rps23 Pro-64 3,4-dihydroxylase Tpa1-like proline 4-hydroxylase